MIRRPTGSIEARAILLFVAFVYDIIGYMHIFIDAVRGCNTEGSDSSIVGHIAVRSRPRFLVARAMYVAVEVEVGVGVGEERSIVDVVLNRTGKLLTYR